MNHLSRYLITVISLTILLAAFHIWAVPRLLPVSDKIARLLPDMYMGLGLIHLGAYLPIWLIWRRAFNYTGFAFIGMSLLKLGVALTLLWSWLLALPQLQERVILHFMGPYLALLTAELLAVYRLLQTTSQGGLRN